MPPKRIVVIDDCRLTLAIARDMLEPTGFEVLTAESGIEANEHIFGVLPPDLLLIDIELPLLNGDRKVRLLKTGKRSRAIPVILMSHKPPEELERLAREAGAEGWVAKPLDPDTLLGQVRRFLPEAR
jgi:DNA-binding response OmpR family regulator